MFSLGEFIDLPLIWGGLIAITIFMYIMLDGFDLGVGILYPFAPNNSCRRMMLNSIAPFWDGNETWLVLGGGGLFAAFPLAYSILVTAFYIPVLLMLVALIFRGVAFEFIFKSDERSQKYWGYAFHFGSIVASFMQGVMLGSFVQGFEVANRVFDGSVFAWVNAFSFMIGCAMVFGYALTGSCWLIMKTEGDMQSWSRKVSLYVLFYVFVFMGIVSLWAPFVSTQIFERWFSWPEIGYLAFVPITTLIVFYMCVKSIRGGNEVKPFILSVLMFALGYIGLAVSIWPWVVPYKVNLWEAAAMAESQSLLLVAVIVMLPVVLCYTGYCYYVFRGKVTDESFY